MLGIAYDGVNLRRTVDPLGRETRYDYDAINRITAVTDALSQVRSFSYDTAFGQTTRTMGDHRLKAHVQVMDAWASPGMLAGEMVRAGEPGRTILLTSPSRE